MGLAASARSRTWSRYGPWAWLAWGGARKASTSRPGRRWLQRAPLAERAGHGRVQGPGAAAALLHSTGPAPRSPRRGAVAGRQLSRLRRSATRKSRRRSRDPSGGHHQRGRLAQWCVRAIAGLLGRPMRRYRPARAEHIRRLIENGCRRQLLARARDTRWRNTSSIHTVTHSRWHICTQDCDKKCDAKVCFVECIVLAC